jgi:DnaJ-domain-containing protein 1
MTQITANQLTKRVQQLDDAQAGTVLRFIEFLLTQPSLKEQQDDWRANKKRLEALNRIYGDKSNDPNSTYELALRAMTRRGLPTW